MYCISLMYHAWLHARKLGMGNARLRAFRSLLREALFGARHINYRSNYVATVAMSPGLAELHGAL